MDNPTVKSKELRYIEMARQVSKELIENLSAEEQNNFVQEVKERLEENYANMIEEADQHLKSLHNQRDTFRGDRLEVVSETNRFR